MRRAYLLPILAFIPLILVIYTFMELDYKLSPTTIVLLIAAYLAVNIIYGLVKKIFHISILVELALVALIAYFVLSNLS